MYEKFGINQDFNGVPNGSSGFLRLSFTPENPTGNYFLDLANPADFAVAEQVLVLNQWEILQLVSEKKQNNRKQVKTTWNT